jgi:two-component sensor histidine kinase
MTDLADPARLSALSSTELLDSAAERDFDRITELASRLLGAPVALISLVDDSRQFFKSQVGLPAPYDVSRETPLSHSFCQHVVLTREALAVTDAPNDPRVRDNLAIRDLGVMAYLGVPLKTEDGHVLGSLCAIDGQPREWTPGDLASLRDLAELVMDVIALRSEIKRREVSEQQQELLIAELHHRVKNTLATVQAVIHMSLRAARDMDSFRDSIGQRIASLANTHTLLSERRWHAMSFKELMAGELRPYENANRITIDGPDFKLPAQTAVTFGMILHELTTNASKYGALSRGEGVLAINWTLSGDEAERRIQLTWRESKGPAVAPPTRDGFGSTLLRRIIQGELRGTVDFDFKPGGLEVHAEAKLPQGTIV